MNSQFSSWSDKNDAASQLHQQHLQAQQQNQQVQQGQQGLVGNLSGNISNISNSLANNLSNNLGGNLNNPSIEDKFDPSFAREEHDETYPGVVDEVAAAAVVAQKRGQVQQLGHSHLDEDDDDDDKKDISGPHGALTDIGSDVSRNPGGGGGHKPLSGTKRALQNRKAQRAFRQRKDKYVKDLEAKANEVEHLKQQLDQLRNENMELRDYTLALQSRLIELSPTGNSGGGDITGNSGEGSVPAPPSAFSSKGYGEK